MAVTVPLRRPPLRRTARLAAAIVGVVVLATGLAPQAHATSDDPAPPPSVGISVSPGDAVTGSDSLAALQVTVDAHGQALESLTIHYGQVPGDATSVLDVPVIPDQAVYQPFVTDLTNGVTYQFIAEVCLAGGICARSETITFMPWGTPQVTAPQLTASRSDVPVYLRWFPVRYRGFPGTLTCQVNAYDVASGERVATAVPDTLHSSSLVFRGTFAHSYWASYACYWAEGSGATGAWSNVVTIRFR